MTFGDWFSALLERHHAQTVPPITPLPARHVETDRLFREQLSSLVAANTEQQTANTTRATRGKLDSVDDKMMTALGLKHE